MKRVPSSASSVAPVAVEQSLRRNRGFARWPAPLFARLAATVRLGYYQRGAKVLSDDPEVPDTCAIISGRLLLKSPNAGAADESLLGLLGPDMVFGGLTNAHPGAPVPECVALEPAVVLHIPTALLCELLDRQPQLWGDMSLMLLEQEHALLTTLIGQVTGTVTQRVSQTLLQYATLHGSPKGEAFNVVLRMSQEDLGTLLQLSRRTIGKELKGLEDAGLINRGYNLITIPSMQALHVFAGALGRARAHPADRCASDGASRASAELLAV